MNRTVSYRWWLLALVVVLTTAGLLLPGRARADVGFGGPIGIRLTQDNTGDQSLGGDPDVPINTKGGTRPQTMGVHVGVTPDASGIPAVGRPYIAWPSTFRMALLMIRAYVLR